MWTNVDVQKRLPGRVDGETAIPWLLGVDIRSPAHNYLTVMKDNPVKHASSAADAALIGVTDHCEEFRIVQARFTPETTHITIVRTYSPLYLRSKATCPATSLMSGWCDCTTA